MLVHEGYEGGPRGYVVVESQGGAVQAVRVEEGIEGEGPETVGGSCEREEIRDVEVSEDLEEEFVGEGCQCGVVGRHFRVWCRV